MTSPQPAEAVDGRVEGAPGDNTSLTEVLDAFIAGGYLSEMEVHEDGTIACMDCAYRGEPSRFRLHVLRRLEGASDPDDMLAVVGLECPNCKHLAAVVLQYGPNAPSEHAEVLRAVRDDRTVTPGPRDMAPDEAVDPDPAGECGDRD